MPNRLSLDFDRLSPLIEPPAFAGGTRGFRHQLVELAAGIHVARFPEFLEIGHETDEGAASPAAAKNFLLDFLCLFREGLVDIDVVIVL